MSKLERDLSDVLGGEVSLIPPTKAEEERVGFLKMELALQLVDDHPMQSRIDGFVSVLRGMGRHEDAIHMMSLANEGVTN